MAGTLTKLRPDRDLVCYFERPSAVAALSDASATSFRISGSWRQQFDWAVVEWSRDNTFEHPWFRYLPDSDLSTLVLSYEEEREHCIPLDSDLYATVDWPYLRVWAEDSSGAERLHRVRLRDFAVPVEGGYKTASATMVLEGIPTPGDYVELACLSEHYTHQVSSGQTLADVVAAIADAVNLADDRIRAEAAGNQITLYYTNGCVDVDGAMTGGNGNRIGVYGNVAGAKTEFWLEPWKRFSGGESPVRWKVTLNFGALADEDGELVPTGRIRRMRWTYAADLQSGSFERTEFSVSVSNWMVAGSSLRHRFAGRGTRRIEDDDRAICYAGSWSSEIGNYSGGSIRYSSTPGAEVLFSYEAAVEHELYIGSRRTGGASAVEIVVDGEVMVRRDLRLPGEDVLVRVPVGSCASGAHIVECRHIGNGVLYFDFAELAIPTFDLPVLETDLFTTLATDWDTDHSLALAPERTAWILSSLGFRGRANHYVGALLFYELTPRGLAYASASVEFFGTPVFSATTELRIGVGGPESSILHVNLIGDTKESIVRAFELALNGGYTAVWAEAEGSVLTLWSRSMGGIGNEISLAISPADPDGSFYGEVSGRFDSTSGKWYLTGGTDPVWRTDLQALPRLNRAARDWSRSYFRTLRELGVSVTAAFSMELQHGDPSPEAAIAQRYPSGQAVILNTPAIQTNFGPQSLLFWQQVYLDMARVMSEAGVRSYLQFGEVQWWYFPDQSGLPYYDAHTLSAYEATYGRSFPTFVHTGLDPTAFPDEVSHLQGLVGSFTDAVMHLVRTAHPEAVFEVLYPLDVNAPAWSRAVNYPIASWTPLQLECLKTENFTYTFQRDLNRATDSILYPVSLGFSRRNASHLVGVSDYTTPWRQEIRLTKGEALESAVIWALDQFCLIGYHLPLEQGQRQSRFQA